MGLWYFSENTEKKVSQNEEYIFLNIKFSREILGILAKIFFLFFLSIFASWERVSSSGTRNFTLSISGRTFSFLQQQYINIYLFLYNHNVCPCYIKKTLCNWLRQKWEIRVSNRNSVARICAEMWRNCAESLCKCFPILNCE